MIETIGFDADDTLWHNERIFLQAKEKYTRLLARYHEVDWIEERLDATEVRNIRQFGYGVKGFTLSMIETAVELTEGRVTGSEISDIIVYAKEMLAAPIEILPGVRETVEELASIHRLIVITKGDLFDQEAKVARSGLGGFFDEVEIVSNKKPEAYKRIAERHGIEFESFLMVGNSLRSDILPVLSLGGLAVHVPYETEWWHERATDGELEGIEITRIESMAELPELVRELS
ncbi:MAG: HAD family hydrolase [Aridibacter famidurans]|nr:HAD family hydrolase [Aridibacter famidurans]